MLFVNFYHYNILLLTHICLCTYYECLLHQAGDFSIVIFRCIYNKVCVNPLLRTLYNTVTCCLGWISLHVKVYGWRSTSTCCYMHTYSEWMYRKLPLYRNTHSSGDVASRTWVHFVVQYAVQLAWLILFSNKFAFVLSF